MSLFGWESVFVEVRGLGIHGTACPILGVTGRASYEKLPCDHPMFVFSCVYAIDRHGESIVNDGSARRYKCLFGGDDP